MQFLIFSSVVVRAFSSLLPCRRKEKLTDLLQLSILLGFRVPEVVRGSQVTVTAVARSWCVRAPHRPLTNTRAHTRPHIHSYTDTHTHRWCLTRMFAGFLVACCALLFDSHPFFRIAVSYFSSLPFRFPSPSRPPSVRAYAQLLCLSDVRSV